MALALKDTQQPTVVIVTCVYFPYVAHLFSNNFNFFFCFFVHFILLISGGYGDDAVAYPSCRQAKAHYTP